VGYQNYGQPPDPRVRKVAPLAAVFGVPATYLVDRKGQPTLDTETLDALANETASAILRASARLPEREKRVVLGVVREFRA
jgi:DNA-directed RNA polymerase specialized sigma24 family protein